MLNRSDENEHLSLFIDLRKKAATLSLFHMMLVVRVFFFFNLVPFIRLRKLPSLPSLLNVVIMKECWILSDAFSAFVVVVVVVLACCV